MSILDQKLCRVANLCALVEELCYATTAREKREIMRLREIQTRKCPSLWRKADIFFADDVIDDRAKMSQVWWPDVMCLSSLQAR